MLFGVFKTARASAILASVEKASVFPMKTLRSYIGDRWVEGSGARQTLVNPATEEPLAEASSDGLDLAAALAWSGRRRALATSDQP